MTGSEIKPGDGPFPPVPAGGARQGDAKEDSAADLAATISLGKTPPPVPARDPKEDSAAGLAATISLGKTPPVPEREPAETADEGELGATLVRAKEVKLLSIPGLKLVKELGRGAHGVVYHGKQEFLDREVAVKMLLEHRQNPEFAARFKREAKLLAGLQHPHVVVCYQADVTPEGVCFLVMEYVDGPNLREFIEDHGPLDVADALRVCRDLAAALGSAYEKKIIHRDVKSENVLLAREPGAPETAKFRYRAKLSDLGLARPQAKDVSSSASLHLTVESTVMGTPLNMSPEQFDDPQGVDHRTDIYSLGCVLYDMLTGRTAFKERTLSSLMVAKHTAVRGPDPRRDRAGIDAGTSELVGRMLAAKREDRPQSYAELTLECERLLGRQSTARLAAPPRSKTAGVIAVVALALIGVAVVWWTFFRETDPPEAPPAAVFALALDPPKSAREGEEVVLAATVAGADGAAPVLAWEQVGEPRVDLKADGPRATFVAPRALANYDLTFVVRGDAAGKSAESPKLTFTVEARDDPPAISVEVPEKVGENERVTVTAGVVDPDAHGELTYAWRVTSGPKVELDGARERVSFTAPEAANPYSIALALEVTAGRASWSHGPTVVQVAAKNDPPRVALTLPTTAEAGEEVLLDAEVHDVDSAGELKHEWRSEGASSPAVVFADPAAVRTRFVAPESASGDYELELALHTTDGAEAPTKAAGRLAVRCDPALAPLAKSKETSWMGTVVGTGLAGWAQSQPAPTVKESPEQDGFMLESRGPEAWIERAPNRGPFVIGARIQPQASRPTGACGLRLATADGRAASVCLLGKPGDERDLVAFASSRADGAWPRPGPEKIATLAPWKSYETIELEVEWNGTGLRVRWRAAAAAKWSEPMALELSSRPRSVALFASEGSLLVNDVRIRGL